MTDYLVINNIEELKDFVDNFNEKEFALDTEFTSLDWYTQKLIGLSIYNSNSDYPATFIQFNFDYTYTEKVKDPNNARKKIAVDRYYSKTDSIDIDESLPLLHELFDGAKCICANGKVEIKVLAKYGLDTFTIVDDVNLMSWLLNCSTQSGLKQNVKRELGIQMDSYEATVGMKVDNINWNLVDFEKYGKCGAMDAWATWELRAVYRQKVDSMKSLQACYERLELPLIPEVAKAEMLGVKIDVNLLKAMSKEAAVDLKKAQEAIFEIAGIEFNVGSPKQLGEVLYDRFGIPCNHQTASGARAVNEAALKEMAYAGYDVADYILEYRKLDKLKGTYIDAIPLMVDADGRLRGNLNATGTRTGRFSSSKPNLQNQPNNDRYPIKKAFIPREGYSFIVVDWSTIEIRIMAHESGDPTMTSILKEGRDVHQETADNVYRQTGVKLTRSQGKTVNFAILYGMGAPSLAYSLNAGLRSMVKKGTMTREEYKHSMITERQAVKIIDGYMGAYKGFTEWGKKEVAHSKKTGWVWTLGGRRRPVPELRNKKTFNAGKRIVVNTLIQGGAGDLMKLGILKLAEMFKEQKFDANTLLYIHDEYVIEVANRHRNDCLKEVIKVMDNIFPQCTVPIICEGDIFDNWAGLKQGGGTEQKSTVHKLKKLKLIA
jgi:DNA polymerase I